jgi:hypothetical protein
MKYKNKSKNLKNQIYFALIIALCVVLLVSCGDSEIDLSHNSYGDASHNSGNSDNSDNSGSSDNSQGTFFPDADSSIIQKFPKEKLSHSVLDDKNFYLMVQTVKQTDKGTESCIREFASKGEDAYASLREGDNFQWYYSNGNATFSFDDEAKVYEIYDFNPLSVVLFSNEKTEEGTVKFFDVECTFVKYKLDSELSIMHFYRKSDGSWVGFQYMQGENFSETNIVLASSEEYPEHVVFSIPEDYKYYFEQGDNVASIDWS